MAFIYKFFQHSFYIKPCVINDGEQHSTITLISSIYFDITRWKKVAKTKKAYVQSHTFPTSSKHICVYKVSHPNKYDCTFPSTIQVCRIEMTLEYCEPKEIALTEAPKWYYLQVWWNRYSTRVWSYPHRSNSVDQTTDPFFRWRTRCGTPLDPPWIYSKKSMTNILILKLATPVMFVAPDLDSLGSAGDK